LEAVLGVIGAIAFIAALRWAAWRYGGDGRKVSPEEEDFWEKFREGLHGSGEATSPEPGSESRPDQQTPD